MSYASALLCLPISMWLPWKNYCLAILPHGVHVSEGGQLWPCQPDHNRKSINWLVEKRQWQWGGLSSSGTCPRPIPCNMAHSQKWRYWCSHCRLHVSHQSCAFFFTIFCYWENYLVFGVYKQDLTVWWVWGVSAVMGFYEFWCPKPKWLGIFEQCWPQIYASFVQIS